MKPQYIKKTETKTEYFSDEKMTILHREDGPAIEYPDGSKSWWVNGKRHRENGPAVECANGTKEWWVCGKQLTKKEFNDQVNPKTIVLDGVKYKLVPA